jgi:hypothetical protein
MKQLSLISTLVCLLFSQLSAASTHPIEVFALCTYDDQSSELLPISEDTLASDLEGSLPGGVRAIVQKRYHYYGMSTFILKILKDNNTLAESELNLVFEPKAPTTSFSKIPILTVKTQVIEQDETHQIQCNLYHPFPVHQEVRAQY